MSPHSQRRRTTPCYRNLIFTFLCLKYHINQCCCHTQLHEYQSLWAALYCLLISNPLSVIGGHTAAARHRNIPSGVIDRSISSLPLLFSQASQSMRGPSLWSHQPLEAPSCLPQITITPSMILCLHSAHS